MSNLLENLNKEQSAAVKHGAGPLLIVAGAGTGKTTVITRRFAYLVEQKLAKPEEILALTFTDKAAGEMEERVDLLLPLGYNDLWISTFHSFCERVLKTHALDIGIPNDFALLDEVRQWIFIYKNFDKFNLDYYRPMGNPNRFIDALITHFSRCKDELISPAEYLEYAQGLRLSQDNPERVKGEGLRAKKKQAIPLSPNPSALSPEADLTEISRLEEVANAFHVYQKLLLDNNYLDFGDLINYTLELFKKRPQILKYYQNKFKFLMVDEFQDTNYAQYQLVKMLSGHNPSRPRSEPRPDQNLVVVGDDDQSIYKFRGASVSNILKFKEDYPKLKEITLLENYRSTQKILDLAYNFIQANNPDRLEIKLKINKQLKAAAKEKGQIMVLEARDLSGELNLVSKQIINIKKQASETTWNDFAILIRANSAANELLPVLNAGGIPFTFVANKGLYKKSLIVDLLAYIKLLDDCHDSASLYRVLTLPKFKLPHHDLAAMLQYGRKKTVSLYQTLENINAVEGLNAASKKTALDLVSALKRHTELAKRSNAAEIFVQIVKDLGLEKKLEDDTLEAAENRELLDQFYKKIENFEQQNSDKSLHNFLYNLNLEIEAGSEGEIKFDPNQGPESVKVLTIHSAKGLEFSYVFIINMVDQRFPTRAKGEAIEIPKPLIKDILPEGDFHLQEERRLFYVAVTRAKKGLFLSWAKDYGGARNKKPSVFLQETNLAPGEEASKATGKVIFTKPAKQTEVYQVLPNRFSYSQINDFKICPLRYKYVHYLKLPVPGTHHLSFGSTIHKVFEKYLNLYKESQEFSQADLFGKKNTGEIPEFKILEQLYQKEWVDDWYENKKQKEMYRALGKDMLKLFYESLLSQARRPKYIEKFFQMPLGNFTFVGKIDRADSLDGGIEILDYKTGKSPKKGESKDIDQLRVYQWAAQEFLGEKVLGMKYWFLLDNTFIAEAVADKTEIEDLKKRLLEITEKIVQTTKYDLFKKEHSVAKSHACEFEHLE